MVSLISFELQQWKLRHQLINTWPAKCELVEVSLGSWLLLERLHLSIPGSARRTQDVAENLGVSMGGLENLASQAYLSTELKWKQPTLFYLTWSALNAKPKKPTPTISYHECTRSVYQYHHPQVSYMSYIWLPSNAKVLGWCFHTFHPGRSETGREGPTDSQPTNHFKQIVAVFKNQRFHGVRQFMAQGAWSMVNSWVLALGFKRYICKQTEMVLCGKFWQTRASFAMVAMGKDLKAESRHFRSSIWLLTLLFCPAARTQGHPGPRHFSA